MKGNTSITVHNEIGGQGAPHHMSCMGSYLAGAGAAPALCSPLHSSTLHAPTTCPCFYPALSASHQTPLLFCRQHCTNTIHALNGST